jgi:hypothetical protein
MSSLRMRDRVSTQFKPTGKIIKGKAIAVRGSGGPYGCDRSRLPYFLENRLIDGGEVVSLNRPLPQRKIPGTHFC